MYLKLLFSLLGICALALVATANKREGSLNENSNNNEIEESEEFEEGFLENHHQWYYNQWRDYNEWRDNRGRDNRRPDNRWPDNRGNKGQKEKEQKDKWQKDKEQKDKEQKDKWQKDKEQKEKDWKDKWQRGFRCPAPFGLFSDITDCEYFFECQRNRGTRRKCPQKLRFDKNRKKCLSWVIAVCDKGGKDDKPEPKTTANPVTKKDAFICPSLSGYYMHPEDCSQYYACTFFVGVLKSCPQNQLFDGIEKKCKPASEVHCGSRKRPEGYTTPLISTLAETTLGDTTPEETTLRETTPEETTLRETTPEESTLGETSPEETTLMETTPAPEETTLEETTPAESTLGETSPEETTLVDTTPEETTLTETTQEETTLAETTPEETTLAETTPEETPLAETTPEETPLAETTPVETTLREITTTEQITTKVQVTAPETQCDEDDVDCIINDLGEKPKWFNCPTDMGSFPHPSSKKLFIFCINWKPSVKKCAHGLIFSEERQTCVES